MSAVQFDSSKSYALDLSNDTFILKAAQGSSDSEKNVLERVKTNIKAFCDATSAVVDTRSPISKERIVSLVSFGEQLCSDTQAKCAHVQGMTKKHVVSIKKSIHRLKVHAHESNFQCILDGKLDKGTTLEMLKSIFYQFGKGQIQECEKANNFVQLKELFFRLVAERLQQVTMYEFAPTSEAETKYKKLIQDLTDCFQILKQLFIHKRNLFQEQDLILVLDLEVDLTNPKWPFRNKLQIKEKGFDWEFQQMLYNELIGQTEEIMSQKYESMLKQETAFEDCYHLKKLVHIFRAITFNMVVNFDKPKNFQAIKGQFFHLVGNLIQFQKERLSKTKELDTIGDPQRYLLLLNCFCTLAKMYLLRKELLGNAGEHVLECLSAFLKSVPIKEFATLPELEVVGDNYRYAMQFNAATLSIQLDQLRLMKEKNDFEYAIYLDRFIRNLKKRENRPSFDHTLVRAIKESICFEDFQKMRSTIDREKFIQELSELEMMQQCAAPDFQERFDRFVILLIKEEFKPNGCFLQTFIKSPIYQDLTKRYSAIKTQPFFFQFLKLERMKKDKDPQFANCFDAVAKNFKKAAEMSKLDISIRKYLKGSILAENLHAQSFELGITGLKLERRHRFKIQRR